MNYKVERIRVSDRSKLYVVKRENGKYGLHPRDYSIFEDVKEFDKICARFQDPYYILNPIGVVNHSKGGK